MSTEAATDKLRGLLHEIVCAIELGVLSHVDGSNESPHDGEHPHPWPCERMADGFRAKNLHLTAANWRRDGPHAFFLDPETGDEWPTLREPEAKAADRASADARAHRANREAALRIRLSGLTLHEAPHPYHQPDEADAIAAAVSETIRSSADPKMCCEWADPIVSDSGLMCRSCDSPLLPASKGARIVKAFDRYGIRESEGAAPRAEGLDELLDIIEELTSRDPDFGARDSDQRIRETIARLSRPSDEHAPGKETE